MPRVQRFDRMRVPAVGVTGAGALRVLASLARTGVLEYRAGGETWHEYRPPEEVFAPEAMASFRALPITIAHEGGMVSPSSWKNLACGHVSDRVYRADPWLRADLVISDQDAITRVQTRELAEISAGYACDPIPCDEVYDGVRCAFRQTKIRGNHVTLLPPGHARAGADARLHFDSSSAPALATSLTTLLGDPRMNFKIDAKNRRATLDGKEFDLLEESGRTTLVVALNAVITSTPRMDALDEDALRAKLEETKLTAVSLAENLGQALAMMGDVAEMPEDPEALEAMVGPELMDKAVEERQAVVDKADSLGVETKGRLTADIMRDVLSRRGIRTDGLDPAQVRNFWERVPGATFDSRDRDIARSGGPGGSEAEELQKKVLARRAGAWKKGG